MHRKLVAYLSNPNGRAEVASCELFNTMRRAHLGEGRDSHASMWHTIITTCLFQLATNRTTFSLGLTPWALLCPVMCLGARCKDALEFSNERQGGYQCSWVGP